MKAFVIPCLYLWFSYIKLEKLSVESRQAIEHLERYAKKLTFEKAIKLFLYAINDETDSLRHLDQQLVSPKLKRAMGIDASSYSQLSRALRAIETNVLLEIFNHLLKLEISKNALNP